MSEWFGVAPEQSPEVYLEGSPLDASIYGILLAAALVVLIRRKHEVGAILRKNQPILFFVLFCAVSILWSEYPGVALKRWIKSIGDYAMILIILSEYDHVAALKKVLGRVSFTVIPLSILVVKYYAALGRAYAEHWAGTQYFVGLCDTKNMLGMVCLVFGLGALWRIVEVNENPFRSRVRTYAAHGTIFGMAVWLLVLSDSKTSLSCFVLSGTLIVAHRFFHWSRRSTMLHSVMVAIVIISVSVLFLGNNRSVLEVLGRDPTLTGRTDMWTVLLATHTNPVIGTGFESFWLGPRLGYLWTFPIVAGITEAHNGYLEMYLNLGWAGVAFLAFLLWMGYWNILRLLELDPEAGRIRLALFVTAIIYNFTEAGFRSTDLIWIGFITAVAVPPARIRRVMTRRSPARLALREQERAFHAL